jgi:hypothetical protein
MQRQFPQVKWFWKVWVEPRLFKAAALGSGLLSLALVWSEITFSVERPTLSIFALLLKGQGGALHPNYFVTEVTAFLMLLYLSVCTYRVIFILRVLSFYYIVPKQKTDSSSLLYMAMFLSRLTVPLCLNFLSLCHLDSHVTAKTTVQTDTAFTRVRGRVAKVGVASYTPPRRSWAIWTWCSLSRASSRTTP